MRMEILQSLFGGVAPGQTYGGAGASANDNTADWDSRSQYRKSTTTQR